MFLRVSSRFFAFLRVFANTFCGGCALRVNETRMAALSGRISFSFQEAEAQPRGVFEHLYAKLGSTDHFRSDEFSFTCDLEDNHQAQT